MPEAFIALRQKISTGIASDSAILVFTVCGRDARAIAMMSAE